MQQTINQSNQGYTLLEMLFVVVLIGLFMLIAYQQIQQSAYRRNLAALNGSVKTLQYAMTQYYYAKCADIYTKQPSLTLSDLNQYYPSGTTTIVVNPFNPSDPQSFKLTITHATKGVATKATIETTFPGMSDDQIGQIAASVRPTEYSGNTMKWTFSPFRTIASTGISQSSRASLAVYNIWSSSSAQNIPDSQQSCDYWEYKYQTQ